MYASLRQWRLDGDRFDEVRGKAQETVVPEMRRMEGFVAYYLVRLAEDRGFSVTIFQDREGADEANRVVAGLIRRELPDAFAEPPQIAVGEIVVDATAEAAGGRTTSAPSAAGR